MYKNYFVTITKSGFLENLDGDFAEPSWFALLLGGGTRVGGGTALGVLASV